ncbi:MAG: hypothetical protein F6J87_02555 [Spirulina sp. SIO3F2]|nr:hypothetical protein [Spirulina sp. SIO3F2]
MDWIKQLGITPDTPVGAIALGSTDSLYIGSTTQSETEPHWQATIAQYSLQGEQQWQQSIELPMAAAITHVAVSRDRLYSLGTVNIDAEPEQTQTEVWLAAYTLTGELQWLNKLRSVYPQQPDDLIVDAKGFLYIAGHTTPTDVDPEGWLEKYDPDGDRLWQTSLGKYEASTPLRLCLGEDPTARTKFARMAIYVAGSTAMPVALPNSEEGEAQEAAQQTWLARYSSEGIQRWITGLGPAATLHCAGLTTNAEHQLYGVGQAVKAGVIPAGPWLAQYDAQGQQALFTSLGLAKDQAIAQLVSTPTGLQLVGLSSADEVWISTYTPAGFGEQSSVVIEGQVQRVTGAVAIADGLILSGQMMTETGLQQWVAKVIV